MSASPFSHFEPMIEPTMLEYLHSNSKYGVRSYAWAARQYSPELYRQWLHQRVSELTDEEEIYTLILQPCFAAIIRDSSDEISSFIKFDGTRWIKSNRYSIESFIKKEMDQDFTYSDKFPVSKLSITSAKIVEFDIRSNGLVTPTGTIYLEEDGFIVRPSLPDDFQVSRAAVSLTDLSWDTEEVQQILTWLGQAFYDKEIIMTFLNHLRSVIVGKPERVAWYGAGNNSRHCMRLLVEDVFGDYFSIELSDHYYNRLTLGYACNDLDYDIVIANEMSDNWSNRDKIYFSGRWDEVADVDNQVFLSDPNFGEYVSNLAPAFLWILTRSDITDHLN